MVFLRELKRRRVLHTASIYVVGAWIALQVVEVLSTVGLPPSTMRNLLVALSAGFPVALVIGWFFDISREGIVRTRPAAADEPLPGLNFFDYVLLAGLVAAVVVDAWILSIPPAGDAPQSAAEPAALQRTLAVLTFEDLAPAGEGEGVGETFADELRSSLARIAGLRVLGPETSKALTLAGDSRFEMAGELLVTALLLGDILLDGDRLVIRTRLVGVPAGNELWSAELEQPVGETAEVQNGLVRDVVRAVAPGLDPDPVRGPRAESGACSDVYELYLRGKQLSKARRKSQARMYQRGMELLREAVAIDGNCALAWEAIAVGELEWTTPGFAKAGAAARRALELNDTLPSAWAVLAEIAEQDENWDQAEEYYLRALHADPANAHVNYMYSEALMARGRHRDALHYVLEAYRYEPVSSGINFRVAMSAFYAGESDVVLERAEIARDIDGSIHPWVWDLVAEAYLQKGDTGRALEAYARIADDIAPWFTDCVEARGKPEQAQRVLPAVRETLQQYRSGQLTAKQGWDWGWNIIRCGIWLGEPDLVFGVLDADGVPPFESGVPTEIKFATMFHPDGAVMRRHPRFARMVVDSGLLDYWKKWGWADMCVPDGDGYRCD